MILPLLHRSLLLICAAGLAQPLAAQTTTTTPLLRDLRVTARGGDSLRLDWESSAPMHTIEYRALPDGAWQEAPSVKETDYNLIFLRPETGYEVRVRAEGAARAADSAGTSSALSNTVVAETTPLLPLTFAGVQVQPPAHLDTFTSNTWYPTVEYHDGALWVLESLGNALHLSKVDPETRRVAWTKVVVPAVAERPTYQGIMDMTVHGGKLWIMWNFQDTNNPAGYVVTQSRQRMRSYDFATGELSEPVTLEPVRPGAGTWEGGVESWRGRLWTMQMDVWLEGEKRRTQIVLRPYDEAGGTFGEAVRYESCPTAYPYGPSMSVFGEDLVLLFSDLAAYEKDRNREPLLYTVYDGRSFAPARTILDEGRSRYAKGVQLGDRFVLAYKCNLPYYKKTGNRFHDIALTVLDPKSGDMQTTMTVSDVKYNSSPDVTRVEDGRGDGDRAVMVFGKWEHVYTDKADPTANFGAFIAEVRRVPSLE